MKRPYVVKKQWRAIGACEFDVFHRDTLAKVGDDIVGTPYEVYAVMRPVAKPTKENTHEVIADSYTRSDANKIARALNAAES